MAKSSVPIFDNGKRITVRENGRRGRALVASIQELCKGHPEERRFGALLMALILEWNESDNVKRNDSRDEVVMRAVKAIFREHYGKVKRKRTPFDFMNLSTGRALMESDGKLTDVKAIRR